MQSNRTLFTTLCMMAPQCSPNPQLYLWWHPNAHPIHNFIYDGNPMHNPSTTLSMMATQCSPHPQLYVLRQPNAHPIQKLYVWWQPNAHPIHNFLFGKDWDKKVGSPTMEIYRLPRGATNSTNSNQSVQINQSIIHSLQINQSLIQSFQINPSLIQSLQINQSLIQSFQINQSLI